MLAMLTAPAVCAAPPTLDKPGKKVRCISLAEARAIALEQGHVGQPSLLFAANGHDNLAFAPEGEGNPPARVCGKRGSKIIVLVCTPSDLQPAEFERNINQMLLNIENAYWNLYGSYWQLFSREQGLRLAYETWKDTEAQYRVGRVSKAALAQAEGQYDLLRSQRLQALDTVLDNERQLRAMMGMAISDGTRLVPCDEPTLVEKTPDWKQGLHSALKHRPELRMSRQDVQLAARKAELAEGVADYIPIKDGVRQAELQLARARLVLNDQELKTERFLGLYYRRMSSAYAQIQAARAQREAFAQQVKIRGELYSAGANEPGGTTPVTLNLLLESQRFWAEALATECQAIVTYNNSLAGWEYAKGEILKHAHVRLSVRLSEEAPDDSGTVRAAELEHTRTRRHVRHESAVAAASPLAVLDACGRDAKTVPSLPALWKRFPLLKEVGDVQTGPVEGRVPNLN
jgi:hypothetical protein